MIKAIVVATSAKEVRVFHKVHCWTDPVKQGASIMDIDDARRLVKTASENSLNTEYTISVITIASDNANAVCEGRR